MNGTIWKNVYSNPPYEGQRCLVFSKYWGQVKILVYNSNCECWDDEEGDDYYCDLDMGEDWTDIPEHQ